MFSRILNCQLKPAKSFSSLATLAWSVNKDTCSSISEIIQILQYTLANLNSPVPNKDSIFRITEFVPISEDVHFYGRVYIRISRIRTILLYKDLYHK